VPAILMVASVKAILLHWATWVWFPPSPVWHQEEYVVKIIPS